MSKSIKVEDKTYQRLERLIVHRETFNMVIVRLLRVYDILSDVSKVLGPNHYSKEFKHGPEQIRDLQER